MENDATEFKKLFPKGQIPFVLAAIFQAGDNLRKKTERDREDWITRRLYARLIKIPIYRDGPLDIRMQTEIPASDPDSNYPAGRIDILVSCGQGAEVYFAIEAKRLRVSSSRGTLVLGNTGYVLHGMMRFVTGQYAPFMEAGAMLGYVYDGKTDEARVNIDIAIEKRAHDLKLIEAHKLSRSGILPKKLVDETTHELEKRIFAIYHVFLVV
ncbi:MAG: hypothetical protein ABFR82_04330 [Nitrospirota bacterium]